MAKQAKTKQEMGTGSVKKLMVKMAVPALVGQVVNLLYNIVDRIYIGHIPEIGGLALTGVGLFTPILMLITAFSMLAGAGGAPRAAIAMGQGDKDRAEKIVAKAGDKNYGITSVILQYYFTCKKTRIVSKKMFTPAPKVDSAVITMRRKTDVPFDGDFSNFVRKMFAMKRKTIVNNLNSAGFEKNKILAALMETGVSEAARAETLDFGTIRQIFENIAK